MFSCVSLILLFCFSLDVICMYVSFRGEKGTDEPEPINNLESYDSSGKIITKVRALLEPKCSSPRSIFAVCAIPSLFHDYLNVSLFALLI
jgi:hypothetical protein